MKLSDLRDNPGARKKRMRVGRGEGSGKGKTCGSGVKGQKARTGVSIRGFEGGQNPLYRRLPKRGFNNIFKIKFAILNLYDLQAALDQNKIESSAKITEEMLFSCGIVRKNPNGIKVLGVGEFNKSIQIEVHAASSSARKAIEKNNGTLTIIQR